MAYASQQKHRVFIPDFFEGQPADISWFPPQTEEHQQKLGHFFETKAVPSNTISKIPGVVSEGSKSGNFEFGLLSATAGVERLPL